MRKPVFPRILLLVLLYCVLFAALVLVQFARKGGFTQRVGSFVVTGHYRLPGENDPPLPPDEYLLDGEAHVFFGGIDFSMTRGGESQPLALAGKDGTREETLPEKMILSGDSARFVLPGGTELEFSSQYSGGSLEMRISGNFSEGITAAELPFKLLRKAEIKDTMDGKFTVRSDGVNYSFEGSPIDSKSRLLLLTAKAGQISYRAIPDRKTLSPGDFILPKAKTAGTYNDFLTRWRDQNFSLWNRTIQQENNEDLVIAYEGEALVRGTYKAALSAVPSLFLRGTARTYESSVYLGDMEQAYRSIVVKDREKIARLSRLINEKSLEFLKEPRVFKYFAVRGLNNFVDAGADLVRTIDPAVLALDITPGILEGYLDWKTFRPNTENPFERLVDQACFVISQSLHKTADSSGNDQNSTGGRVFSFNGSRGDTEFNLSLGKALLVYAESVNNASLAGIGRSLVISALSMGDVSGTVKAGLILSDTGEIKENPEASSLTTARLYRILSPLDAYPRSLPVIASPVNIWAWTTAQAVSGVQQKDVLDLNVKFPAGETHYMIIRGIRPFARLQLYNMDFRSDPQFERYDSSGWAYYPQDQILVLKMKHRVTDEHVRIIFKEAAPPPAPASQPAAPAAAAPASPPQPAVTNNAAQSGEGQDER